MSDLPPPPEPPSGWPQQGPPGQAPPGQWGQQPGAQQPGAPTYGQQPGYGAQQPPPGAGPWGAPSNYGYGGPTGPGYAAQKAGFWIRFLAYFIDGIVVSVFNAPAYIVAFAGPKEEYVCTTFDNGGFDSDGTGFGTGVCERPTGAATALMLIFYLAALVAAVIYFAQMEGKRGQTLGKMAAGIKVVDINTGGPIGVGRGVGRYFARWLSGIPCGLGYFWMLWDPQKQTWHDKLTSSVVVRT